MPDRASLYIDYLLTDPKLLGVVTWVGFAGTAIGLAVALWQIRRVKSAAEAAAVAARELAVAVQARERMLELHTARSHLDTARHHLGP